MMPKPLIVLKNFTVPVGIFHTVSLEVLKEGYTLICRSRALLAFGAFRQAKSPSFPCHTLNRHPERGEPYA
jgi:hypothetical protein